MADFGELIERPGSIQSLDAAAAWRYAEAGLLREAGRRAGALYLLGYVAEIRLTAAIFRVRSFRLAEPVLPKDIDELRRDARKHNLMSSSPHDIAGWGRYLTHFRSFVGRPMPKKTAIDVHSHSAVVYDHWRARLRYKALVPTQAEFRVTQQAVQWLNESYNLLWS